MDEKGFQVPLLAAGESGLVIVHPDDCHPQENEDELVATLGEFGFVDAEMARVAIRTANGDVNAAALAFLRQQAPRK